MKFSNKGQSTLEYIIIFTVIVGAILFFANTTLKQNVGNMLVHVSNQAVVAVNHVNFE